MRASTWPGEVNAFHLCIYGSWIEPGLILTTINGHQNTIMMAISALERFRAEQQRNGTVNSRDLSAGKPGGHRLEQKKVLYHGLRLPQDMNNRTGTQWS